MKKLLSNFPLNLLLIMGFGTSIVILCVASLFSFLANQALINNAKRVDSTNAIIQKLELLLSTVKDAETGQRGFLISKNQEYLEPYYGAYEKFNRELESVKKLTADNAQQQIRLNYLKILMDSAFKKLDYSIEQVKSRNDVSKTWSTKIEVDKIRKSVKEIQTEEYNILNNHLKEFNISTVNAPLAIVIFFTFSFGLIFISYSVIRFNVKKITEDSERIKRNEVELAEFNKEIQTINEELKASNEEMLSANEELSQSREELIAINEELEGNILRVDLYRQELQESKERLEDAQAIANLGNWEWDVRLNTIYWSDELKRIFDFDPTQLPQFDYPEYLSLIHPDDKDRLNAVVENTFKTGVDYNIEHRLIWKNGSLRWIQAKGKAIFSGGIIIKLVGIALDITNLREAENEQQKLASLVENSFDFICLSELNGKVIYLNKAGRNLIGIQEEALADTNITDFLHQDEQIPIKEKVMPLVLEGKSWSGEVNFKNYITEQLIPMSWNVFLVKDKTNKPIGIACVSQDLSQIKKAKHELQQINEELSAAVEELRQAEEGLAKANLELEKRVEQRTKELAESNERFRLVSKATNDAIWDWDLNANSFWLNDGFKTMFGYDDTQIIKTPDAWRNKIHKNDRERIINSLQDVINQGGKLWSAEYRYLNANGDYIDVFDRAYVLYNKNGEPYRVLGSMINVTERKKLEDEKVQLYAKAEAERKRLYNVLMQAPAAIALIKGPTHIFEMANDIYYKLSGKSEKIIGKPGREAIPEIVSQGLWDLMDSVYTSGVAFIGKEFLVNVDRNGDGTLATAYFNFLAEPIFDFEGQAEAILIHAVEVSDLVESRKHIEESAEQLKLVLETIPQMTWTNLPSGEVNFYNQRWYNYTGLSFEETKDWGWQQVVHPDDVELTMNKYRDALKTGKVFELENRYKRSEDGTYRWHLNRAFPIKNDNGEIMHWVGSATDIQDQKLSMEKIDSINTELSIKNEELSKINNDLDNFIYTASHDLKAPVSNIEGLVNSLTDSLNEEGIANQDISMMIDMINQSISRFKETIIDLTEITKIQKNLSHDIAAVNIKDLIDDVKLDVRDMINSSNAQIEIDVDASCKINFSRKNLKSIIYNLMSNAIKYRSEKTPEILIKAGIVDGYILLIVKDNGLGMDLSGEVKIFTMFKRLHDHVEGTGIGLYLVKRIIDNAGGKIEVESELGKGSTFKVYFPLLA